MEELTIEEYIEKYPYLKEMSESTIFTSKEDIKSIEDGEKINVYDRDVYVEFLTRTIKDSNYYERALRYLTGETNGYGACYIIYGDTSGNIYYDKSVLVKGIIELVNSGKLKLSEKEKERYNNLVNAISFDKFMDEYKDEIFEIEIDNNRYSIPVEKIVNLLKLSSIEFDNICSNPNIKSINNIPKEHFIYAVYTYFKKNYLFKKYVFPDALINIFKDINGLQKLDFESLNKHLEVTDKNHKAITIDENLKKEILLGLPREANNLEKAIYIYIKMCKLLTYDEEFFAVNQRGPAAKKHKELSYTSNITLENNKVVCFEFNLIYSKLLDELGIKFSCDYNGMIGESYGEGHANLEFRHEKFLVKADSVTSILLGDIMRAKLNQPLVGLTCLNKNKKTQEEFKQSVTKMYELITKQEDKLNEYFEVEKEETFEDILSSYGKATDNIKDVSLDEKVSILVDKVNATKMIGIDSLSYVLQLKKILFNNDERKNNIIFSIIRTTEELEEGQIAKPCLIISLNNLGFENNPDGTIYFYYTPNRDLVSMTKEQIQEKFNGDIFKYIEKDDPRVVGIEEVGGIKR